MEHVFDSVCRCFGGVPATSISARREAAKSSNSSSPRRAKTTTSSKQSPEIKRRTSRLELQDKEWDGLFQHDTKQKRQQQQSSKPLQYHHAPENPDLEYARAVAQAKLAGADPPRRSPKPRSAPSNKRKSLSSKRDEIFRTRKFEQTQKTCPPRENPTNHLTRLLSNHPGVANALCFANPVRDEDEDDDLPLNQEPDDDSTLNTCEDTITSTLYFDAKYAHVVEKRPPMPLFSHFKVNEEEDQLRRIVASDSHNSLNMIRLFNENKSNTSLEESSSDEDQEGPPPPPQIDRTNVLQHTIPRRHSPPPPDPVKMSSSGSSKSTKSTASTTPSSSSPPFGEEERAVQSL